MRWLLGHIRLGGNPYFLKIQMFETIQNLVVSLRFSLPDASHFSASQALSRHGFRRGHAKSHRMPRVTMGVAERSI
jgi:hypothetical protein